MLARTNRFHGQKELRAVYRGGSSLRRGQIMLKYLTVSQRQTFRAAVVVSKKVSASAVTRNRIRRRIYAVIGEHMPTNKPIDLIISVFDESVVAMSDEQLNKSIKELLKKALPAG